MKFLNITTTIYFSLVLAGCTDLNSFKKAELPVALRGAPLQLVSVRPTKEVAEVNAYQVPERSIFFTQNSGGSAVVGLLFGPLGILANIANIERLNQEMGKSAEGSSLFQLDALQEAASAWSVPVQNSLPEKFSGITLKPFIALTVRDESIGVNTIVGFLAEAKFKNAQGELESWVGHYNYILESALNISALSKPLSDENLAIYRNEVRAGFTGIRKELQRDIAETGPPKRKIALVNSSFQWSGMGGAGEVELAQNGHLTLRTNYYKSIYTATVFPSPTMYSFLREPAEREEK